MNTMNASAGNTIRNEMIAVHFKYVGMYPIVLPPGELGATVSAGCIGVVGIGLVFGDGSKRLRDQARRKLGWCRPERFQQWTPGYLFLHSVSIGLSVLTYEHRRLFRGRARA